jgi:hypothetical protein
MFSLKIIKKFNLDLFVKIKSYLYFNNYFKIINFSFLFLSTISADNNDLYFQKAKERLTYFVNNQSRQNNNELQHLLFGEKSKKNTGLSILKSLEQNLIIAEILCQNDEKFLNILKTDQIQFLKNLLLCTLKEEAVTKQNIVKAPEEKSFFSKKKVAAGLAITLIIGLCYWNRSLIAKQMLENTAHPEHNPFR